MPAGSKPWGAWLAAGRSFISAEDLVLAVPEAWGVNDTGQVIGLGPRWSSASTISAVIF